MATTFNYYIWPKQLADGTRAVRIIVTHERKSRYLSTSIRATKSDIERDGKHLKNRVLLDNIDARLKAYREAFLKVSFPEHLTVDELIRLLDDMINQREDEGFHLNIYDYLAKLTATMEPKTAEGYRTAFNAVRRFAGDNLDINDITGGWVLRFKTFLETEKPVVRNGLTYHAKSKGSRAVSYYLGCLRHVHNMARLEYNDEDTGKILIPRQPFAGKNIVPRMPITEHRTLTLSQIRAISEAKPRCGSRAEIARDVFMLSFMLAGTNTIDLYNLKPSDLDGELLTYNRAKTDSTRRDHARITLKVLPEAADIMRRWKGDKQHLLRFAQRYANSGDFNRAVNKGLKDLAAQLGMEVSLQTYHARHSWGTIARNIVGIDFDTVNAGLNHARQGADRIADIYIARDYSAIWKAQEKVFEAVKTAPAQSFAKVSAAV